MKKSLKELNISQIIKSGREDLNLRPHDPQPCALPSCATSRNTIQILKPLLNSLFLLFSFLLFSYLSLMRTETLIGEPEKPNSSLRRLSIKRRYEASRNSVAKITKVGGAIPA